MKKGPEPSLSDPSRMIVHHYEDPRYMGQIASGHKRQDLPREDAHNKSADPYLARHPRRMRSVAEAERQAEAIKAAQEAFRTRAQSCAMSSADRPDLNRADWMRLLQKDEGGAL